MLVKLTTTCSSSCVYFRSVIFEEVFCKSYSNSFLEIRAVILNSDEQPKPKHKPQLWIDINILIILKQLYKNIYPKFLAQFLEIRSKRKTLYSLFQLSAVSQFKCAIHPSNLFRLRDSIL